MADVPRCAWCDELSAGWAKVEPGYGPPHPSCGQHGAEFSADSTVSELLAERSALIAEVERLRAQREAVLTLHHQSKYQTYRCDRCGEKWPCEVAQACGVIGSTDPSTTSNQEAS